MDICYVSWPTQDKTVKLKTQFSFYGGQLTLLACSAPYELRWKSSLEVVSVIPESSTSGGVWEGRLCLILAATELQDTSYAQSPVRFCGCASVIIYIPPEQ